MPEVLHEAETGGVVTPPKQTMGQFFQLFLPYVAQRVRRKTSLGYEGLARRHIIPHLGGLPLRSIAPQHLTEFYDRLLQNGRCYLTR